MQRAVCTFKDAPCLIAEVQHNGVPTYPHHTRLCTYTGANDDPAVSRPAVRNGRESAPRPHSIVGPGDGAGEGKCTLGKAAHAVCAAVSAVMASVRAVS